ncbi:HAUS augmin-like complex subunit 6 N-terminus domain containing protein [Hyaloscypha variabilis]
MVSPTGPSNLTLFLTNLRLLDLDLRRDWPGISALTFSTKDSQQNQKKRIQCVEWALFQLFALWDPEEARNKLQPFFPPLEPLQSLNLRAALFRCLDQAKKNGVLGRDTVLRKTMLDECKGDRLEEVLAVFSNAVLKKVLLEGSSEEHQALAQQLALENFSYNGERSVLSALITAHKASLSKLLRAKEEARANYTDFANLLDLNDRRIVRRHEQLKQVIEESGSRGKITEQEVAAVHELVQSNWSGQQEWLDTILYGDSMMGGDGLLETRFEKVWKHVEHGSIGELEGQKHVGLLQQLDARVKDQASRLSRWQEFGRTLSKTAVVSPTKQAAPPLAKPKRIDLGFNKHQALQVGCASAVKDRHPTSTSLEEYTRLVENMRSELADVGKPQPQGKRPPRQSLLPEKRQSSPSPPPIKEQEEVEVQDEEWSSVSETDEPSPGSISYATKSTSRTPPSEAPPTIPSQKTQQKKPPVPKYTSKTVTEDVPKIPQKPVEAQKPRSPSPRRRPRTPPPIEVPQKLVAAQKPRSPSPRRHPRTPPPIEPTKTIEPIDTKFIKQKDSDSDLADHILNSVAAASPSPKKPRHTLSLAERTRLSMSRASHSQYSDLHDSIDIPDISRLSIKPRQSTAPVSNPGSSESEGLHADLIERTRKSMAGFEAAQKKAQLERRKSVKDAKKKQRESSYFPKVEEEEVVTPDMSAIELLEGDPDYESVFKSRPKIKTSPAVSPTRIWEDEGED